MGDGTELKYLEEFCPPGYKEPVNLLDQSVALTVTDLTYCKGQLMAIGLAIEVLQKQRKEMAVVCQSVKEAIEILKDRRE
tara:strand:+ start:5928 stop:6167 length:240 start_codon:yes stop_codon:yes gene_type:complete